MTIYLGEINDDMERRRAVNQSWLTALRGIPAVSGAPGEFLQHGRDLSDSFEFRDSEIELISRFTA